MDYLKDIPTNWDDSNCIEGFPGKYIVIVRKKEQAWQIVGVNGTNSAKDIDIDLSLVTNDCACIILENEKGFQQQQISKTKTQLYSVHSIKKKP